jgi:hypothetical protein
MRPALEQAGIRGLTEGQEVSFDTVQDSRSGKIAVTNIQTGWFGFGATRQRCGGWFGAATGTRGPKVRIG